ncbi:hypothetical protein DV737_g5293, partial [Chaetothyriales sp. CBS 132003]
MTPVDELFRKRRLDDPTATFAHSHAGKSHAATVKDHAPPPEDTHDGKSTDGNLDDSNNLEDLEAGPSLPPPDDGTDEQEEGDDAEGRFFESGITARETSALNLLAQDDGTAAAEAEEQIDVAWLKKTALSFERCINKNAQLRAKFEHEPLKFIASEADLDAEIRNLSLLAEHGELYADFVRSGCVASLVGLLAHENSDIAVSACQVLAELTDDDAGVDDAQDRDGVYHVLSAIENLLSEPATHDAVASNVALQHWLVARIKRPDAGARGQVGQNRVYAAEILAILVHRSGHSRHGLAAHTDAVDSILQILAPYRNSEPEERNSDEAEFVQNLFDALACLVQDDLGARQFIDGEGIELCLLMLRRRHKGKGSISHSRAVQVLDHAMAASSGASTSAAASTSTATSTSAAASTSTATSTSAAASTSTATSTSTASSTSTATSLATAADMCTHFVESAAGLGPLFGLFMRTTASAATAEKRQRDGRSNKEAIEHLVGILASLLRSTPAGSAARIRTLAKFVEDNHAKIERLLRLRAVYRERVDRVDAGIARQRQGRDHGREDEEEEWLSTRLDAGLFVLNTLDVVLSWLAAEDDVARHKIGLALEHDARLGPGTGLAVLRKSLRDQLDGMHQDSAHGRDASDMLQALLKCLQ